MRQINVTLLLLLSLSAGAQVAPTAKFGKITLPDLEKKQYAIDSSASAVVLYEAGSTDVEGNAKGGFSLVYREHKRIHILKKSAYDEADVEIPLYTSGDAEEELEGLKAVTYNLEGGKIVESKLERSNVFKEKRSKNLTVQKFTLPNVKEGCIIEYEYRIKSDFLHHVQPWAFQGNMPRLWSEYRLAVPQFLNFVFLSQGYRPFDIRDQKDRTATFTVRESDGARASQSQSFNSGVTEHRWVMKDVPELKHENFTSTLRNHISKIEFQLSAYQYPLNPRDFMGTWPALTKQLLESEYFGGNLKGGNGWLGDVVKPLIAGATTDTEKAKRIFAYVRDNITCTDHSGIYTDKPLKTVLKDKAGNVSEVNLLLTALLRYAEIEADPVILSTSDHGYVSNLYPLRDRFNYVITRVPIGTATYMLDASHPRLGFGKLEAECYNGSARVVNADATELEFTADSLREKKITSVLINHSDGAWGGTFSQVPGYYESQQLREKIKESGRDALFKEIKKAYGIDVTIKDPVIDSLQSYENPIGMRYAFNANLGDEDIIYLNPMLGEGYKENPFKSAERSYPVEMPYTIDETYNLSLFLPEGYEVDELPKQMAVKLNEAGDGYFEYLISLSGNIVSMRSRVKLQRAYFAPDEYDLMREFFGMIVNKHSEQIVLKKKKATP